MSLGSLPRVSIIMPAYNRAEFIGDGVRSLQTQPGIEPEIIVVDDGSSDGSDAIVEAIAAADTRVELVRQRHKGVAAARNTGLSRATGEFVSFLDSDDICAPGKIIRQVRKLAPRVDVTGVVGHRIYFTDIGPDLLPRPGSRWDRKLDICLASAVFRRDVFDRYDGFDEALTFGEDIDFYFRLFEDDAKFIIEMETAIYYRRHANNMTNDETAMHRACLRAYHNSIERRRKSGRTRRLDVFFFRNFDQETEFGGGPGAASTG